MKEVTINIKLDGEILLNIDVLTDNSYVAITDKGRIIFPFSGLEIPHSFKFPIIRQLTDDSFLVADARTSDKMDNCFIYDLEGNTLGQFFAGDGIQDIEVLGDKIVITYFDEGVFGSEGPNN